MNQRALRAGEVFDLLADAPNGLTIEELAAAMQTSLRAAQQAVHDVRMQLGGRDSINVVANPGRGRWRYRLKGTYAEAAPWLRNRLQDLETRVDTIHAVASSIARNPYLEGDDRRKADLIESTLAQLQEALGPLNAEISR